MRLTIKQIKPMSRAATRCIFLIGCSVSNIGVVNVASNRGSRFLRLVKFSRKLKQGARVFSLRRRQQLFAAAIDIDIDTFSDIRKLHYAH